MSAAEMSEVLRECQYDDILGTLDGAKGFFINASDVGNFDLAMKIIEEEKNRRAQPDNPPPSCEGCKYQKQIGFNYENCVRCKRHRSDRYDAHKPEKEGDKNERV